MQKAGVSSLKVDLDASGAVAGVAKALGELIQANLAEIGITTKDSSRNNPCTAERLR
jgi:hypothetical protein